MIKYTKHSAVDLDQERVNRKLIENAKHEYYKNNPEAVEYDQSIRFYMNRKTLTIDDSALPKEIANKVRERDGRKRLR